MNRLESASERGGATPAFVAILIGGGVVDTIGGYTLSILASLVGGVVLLVVEPSASEPFERFFESHTFAYLRRAILVGACFAGGFVAATFARTNEILNALASGALGWMLDLPWVWAKAVAAPGRWMVILGLWLAVASLGGALARARRITIP